MMIKHPTLNFQQEAKEYRLRLEAEVETVRVEVVVDKRRVATLAISLMVSSPDTEPCPVLHRCP